jgi:hypothetical protein
MLTGQDIDGTWTDLRYIKLQANEAMNGLQQKLYNLCVYSARTRARAMFILDCWGGGGGGGGGG